MDTIKSSSELKLECGFYDGDTRTLTVDNPAGGLSAGDIHGYENLIKTKNLLIGDKTGAAFVGFNKARTLDKTTIDVDLS